jgi:hypothetical protein
MRRMNLWANEKTHINGVESFWGYARTRLVKFLVGLEKSRFIFIFKKVNFCSITGFEVATK